MVPRRGRGRTRLTSWTHPSSTTSTKPTPIVPLPGDAAIPAVDPGHQETPVGEGVMSRNHLSHQLNQPPTPAHNHQSTNHEHLQSLTTTLHKLTHLSHSSAGLKVTRLSTLVDAYLSARSSWNSSLPVETQVYKQLILFILLPVHSSLSLLGWKPCLGYS